MSRRVGTRNGGFIADSSPQVSVSVGQLCDGGKKEGGTMRQTHVILRSTTAATRDLFRGPLASPTVEESVAAGVSVEVERLELLEPATHAR